MAEDLERWVRNAVENVEVIDVHTHLFPPSHGDLFLAMIDDLLCYHYLVAELFCNCGERITPEAFFELSKKKKAEIVWDELFVKRLPLSEACRGIVTTLQLLGLEEELRERNLEAIREFLAKKTNEEYCDFVFEKAKVKFVLMTNMVFDPKEVKAWNKLDEMKKEDVTRWHNRFKAAVRVDPILKGDWETIRASLATQGFEEDLEGARQYLKHWAKRMNAVYLMASTPDNFRYVPDDRASFDEHAASKEFTRPSSERASELIDKVLLPVAKELNFALFLKIGARRGFNPRLNPCGGGDGVEVASLDFLAVLCRRNPFLRIMATVLSRENQHELTVIANKFGGQLRVYGCWWYLNSPSFIEETTRMRVEILGSAFLAQHSDARVLDQLLYKWKHSRAVLANVLVAEFEKLRQTGWKISKAEVEREVGRMLGGAYEEFIGSSDLLQPC